jgi:hypothetical protein
MAGINGAFATHFCEASIVKASSASLMQAGRRLTVQPRTCSGGGAPYLLKRAHQSRVQLFSASKRRVVRIGEWHRVSAAANRNFDAELGSEKGDTVRLGVRRCPLCRDV